MELPEDVMAEILSRITVKTLLRLKCVCRQWRRLISSRSFAYLQLNRSVSNPTLLVQEARSKSRILQLDPTSFAPVESSILELDSFTKPLFVGSINGLVCLETYFQMPSAVVILNPSTSFFRGIPTRALQPKVYYRIGFGWDPTADDYKVFRLCCFRNSAGELRRWVEVWSSNLRYWRVYEINCNIMNLPWETRCQYLIMEGFTYFLVRDIRQPTKLVARFDVKNEVLRFIPIPQLLLDPSLFLINLKGTFAASALVESTKVYQVWTMDDDRVGSECWSKKLTFEPIENIKFVYCKFATSINGTQVLLKFRDELILYDLETRETKKIKSSHIVISAYYHVESLLSIP